MKKLSVLSFFFLLLVALPVLVEASNPGYCDQGDGNLECDPTMPPIIIFTGQGISASPSSIYTGESSTLSWGSDAETCTSSQFNTGGQPTGSTIVSPSSTTVYEITCSRTNYYGTGYGYASTTLTVSSPPPAPADLEPIAPKYVSPTSATVGAAATFSLNIRNNGQTAANNFPNSVHIRNDTTGVSSWVSANTLSLSAGASGTASGSYTFSNTNSYSVRICADTNTSGAGSLVSESDETNNCGEWTSITVAPNTPPTVTTTVSANPTTITSGSSSTITWSSSGATSCTSPQFSTGNATAGSFAVAPTVTTIYSVTCSATNAFGTGSDTKNVTITVNPPPLTPADLTPPLPNFVTPTTATAGEAQTFSLTVRNAGQTTATNFPNSVNVRNNTQGTSVLVAANTLTLAGGVNGTASGSYTFADTNSYSVRICANTDTSWNHPVTESNTENNCGDWTTIIVSNPEPPEPDVNPVEETAETTPDGDGPSPTPDIRAVPDKVTIEATATGGATTLYWSATNSTACNVTSSHGEDVVVNQDPGTLWNVNDVVNITRQTRYTLSCSGPSGTAEASVLVNVVPAYNPF